MANLLEEILALETEVWEALVTGDAERDARMLSEDFLGVYPTGFFNKSQHCGQLANGPTVSSYELTSARIAVLEEGQVLLSYLAIWSRATDKPPQKERMYISSIWKRFGTEWKNIFSQDTPAS